MIFRWLILTVAVWVAAFIVPGISYESWPSLLIASLVLGILNTFVKPILAILSFPFIIITLGLFMVIINALLLMVTGMIVSGFHVANFGSALLASLIISVVSIFMNRRDGKNGGGGGGSPIIYFRQKKPSQQKSPPEGKGPIIDV